MDVNAVEAVSHQLEWKKIVGEVLKSDLTITNLSMNACATKHLIGCINELMATKHVRSLALELCSFCLPREHHLFTFRAFMTKEDCPVTDVRIVVRDETTLAAFVNWFDSGPPNQATRIKNLTLEQSESAPYVLDRFPWVLDFNKRGSYGTSTLAANVRELTLKGFYLEESAQSSMVEYLLSHRCKQLCAVCLVNIRSMADTSEAMDGAAKVVEMIKGAVKSDKLRSTYRAISTFNAEGTKHAYMLVKSSTPLSDPRIQLAQLARVNDLAAKWKSFMTKTNSELKLQEGFGFDVDTAIIELKYAFVKEAVGVVWQG